MMSFYNGADMKRVSERLQALNAIVKQKNKVVETLHENVEALEEELKTVYHTYQDSIDTVRALRAALASANYEIRCLKEKKMKND